MPDLDSSALMEISIESGDWEQDPDFNLSYIIRAIKAVRSRFPLLNKKGHIDMVLGDDALIQALNATYRSKDRPTNVLSFPQEELKKGTYLPPHEFVLLGDIVLSYQTIKKESVAEKKPFCDHLQHLVVHGFLHLLGFDHEDEDEAEEMESLEISILQSLNIKNPYEDGE